MKQLKDRGSGCFASVHGSRGGAEIRVCRRQKKEGGKEEGTGWLTRISVQWLRGCVESLPYAQIAFKSQSHARSGLARPGFQESSAARRPSSASTRVTAQVCSCSPVSSVFFPTDDGTRTLSQPHDDLQAFPPSTCAWDEVEDEGRGIIQRGFWKPLKGIVVSAARHPHTQRSQSGRCGESVSVLRVFWGVCGCLSLHQAGNRPWDVGTSWPPWSSLLCVSWCVC